MTLDIKKLIGAPAEPFAGVGKYYLTARQSETLKQKEMCVHGIPILVLARSNLFANDASIAD